MQTFGTPFGVYAAPAFGTAKYSRGTTQEALDRYVGDCPVPKSDLFLGGHSKESQWAWCACVYEGEPILKQLCQLRSFSIDYGGDKLPNGDAFLDPSMPWTVTGKRTRGLLDDAFGRALREGMGWVNKAVQQTPGTQPVHSGTGVDTSQWQGGGGVAGESDSMNKLLLGGVIAFGVWHFLLNDEQPKSVSGFGGYRKRRRRSRR